MGEDLVWGNVVEMGMDNGTEKSKPEDVLVSVDVNVLVELELKLDE